MFRIVLALAALLAAACSTSPAPAPEVTPVAGEASPAAETRSEAPLLRLEDRREYDRAVILDWASDPRPEHRRRVAIAIARIGAASFEDLDADGWQSENEPQAGTSVLLTLAADPSAAVREAVAFAFGETGDLRGVEALFTLTRDDDASVSSRAAEAISKVVPRVPFERYETLLAPDIPAPARLMAVRYLFRYASDQATGSAALLLDSNDAALRREAAYTLSRHAIPQARRRLEAMLSEPDVLTRAYAARALDRIADPASVPTLLSSSAEPHTWVRTNSLRALGSIVDRSSEELSSYQVDEIASLAADLASDPDTGTAASAIELLGRIGTKKPAVREQLSRIVASGTPWHRELALLWLTRTFGVGSLPPLDSIDRPWDRIRIVEGAGAATDGIAIRERFIHDPSPSVRAAVVSSIPETIADGDRAILRAALADPDEVVRAAAIGRTAEAFPEEALQLLREAESRARNETMNDARLAAIDALAGIATDGQDEWLQSLLAEDDPVVRRSAADHVASRAGKRPRYTPLRVDRPLAEYEEIARWASKSHIASIELPRGEIRIALRSDEAPMTAWNFARLASKGYFEGTSFMRVVPNFVIQGGDPRNDMSGGPGYAIRDEINMIRYERGAVGMALSGPDTGGSQFFATHSPQPHLDGGYTVFGHVISGRGTILEQVERGDPVTRVTIKDAEWTQLEVDKVAGVPLPTVIGAMSEDDLMQIVPEYPERRSTYDPEPDVLSYMASLVQPSDAITVVLGTWCHDSQREVPRLLRILDQLRALGVEIPARFIAVDREKKEPADLVARLNVELVSTIIYTRDGVELGRIVETPEGPLEDHLLRIVAGQ